MVFYNPFTTGLGNIPTLVYPARGLEEVFDRQDRGCVERYLRGLWELHQGLVSPETEYMLAMVWNQSENKMADLWTHRKSEEYGFGPLVDIKTFRNLKHYIPDQTKPDDQGCGSGNTIHVVNAEINYWTMLGRSKLKEFLEKRPELPEGMRLDMDFYL